jgi:hypothetical protein
MAMNRRIPKVYGTLAAALLTMAAFSAVRADEPAVLGQVPPDANAVIVINNVKTLSTKLSNAITRLNLPIPLPPDIAGFALRNIGVTDGFDQNSSAALVMLKPAVETDTVVSAPPRVIVLLPTTDSKAMLANLSPTPPDANGISEVTLPGDSGDKGYVANVDKWVALAQDKDAMTAYLAHKGSIKNSLTPEAAKTFSDNDVVVWANVPGLNVGMDKWMEDKQQEFTGMLDLANMNNNLDATAGALQKEVINLYFSGIKQYLKDATTGMFTLKLTDAGVTLGMVSGFKPESPFGKFVTAQKPTGPLTFQGLPGGDFLAAGSFTYNGAAIADLMENVGKQIFANEVIAQDPKLDAYKKMLADYSQMIALTSGGRFVMLNPAVGGKNGLINGAVLTESSDPTKYRDLVMEMLKSPSAQQAQQSMNPDVKQTVTVTEDAATIKGVSLTKIHMGFSLREETPEHPVNAAAKQGLAMIQKMYGPDGATIYTAVVGKRVLTVFGADGPTLEGAVAAAQTDTDVLSSSPTISALKDQIVANPVVVAYLPVAKYVQLAQTFMNPTADAAPAPAAPAGNTAAVLFSAGVTDNTLKVQYHIPIAAITSTMEAVNKFKQSMQGGPVPPMQP